MSANTTCSLAYPVNFGLSSWVDSCPNLTPLHSQYFMNHCPINASQYWSLPFDFLLIAGGFGTNLPQAISEKMFSGHCFAPLSYASPHLSLKGEEISSIFSHQLYPSLEGELNRVLVKYGVDVGSFYKILKDMKVEQEKHLKEIALTHAGLEASASTILSFYFEAAQPPKLPGQFHSIITNFVDNHFNGNNLNYQDLKGNVALELYLRWKNKYPDSNTVTNTGLVQLVGEQVGLYTKLFHNLSKYKNIGDFLRQNGLSSSSKLCQATYDKLGVDPSEEDRAHILHLANILRSESNPLDTSFFVLGQ